MRTTLTLDDSLVAALKEKAAQRNVPFKTMVNQTLQVGLEVMEETETSAPPQATIPRSLGLKTGYDMDKLGQLSEEDEDIDKVQRGL
jgi:hypothetical protein